MHTILRRVALAATIAAFPALAGAQQGTRYTLGTRAGVFNLVGTMRVEPSSGREVEVEVTRQGADAGRLKIETGELRGRQTLRVVYPDDRIRWPGMSRGSSTTLSVSDDGTFSWGRGTSRRVRVTSGDGMDARADLVVRVPKGADIGVWLGVGEATVRNVDGTILVDVAAASVTTSATRGALTLDTGSGDVRVSDAQGSVTIDAGSGDVTLEKVTGDELLVDGGSGDVTARDIKVRRANFDLGSGDTRVMGLAADDLTVDSGSGSVDVALTAGLQRAMLDTGSGDVVLRVPADFGAELEVETGSGGIESELPITVTRRSRSSLVGKVGDGRGRVRIDTGSGEVRLVKN